VVGPRQVVQQHGAGNPRGLVVMRWVHSLGKNNRRWSYVIKNLCFRHTIIFYPCDTTNQMTPYKIRFKNGRGKEKKKNPKADQIT